MRDATNLVILVGKLLEMVENLLIIGLHPSEVTLSYELPGKRALES